jgi:hypothetical protein
MLTARRGLTLLELCVSLLVSGLVLLLVVTIGVREQRSMLGGTRRLARAESLRHGAAVLPIDLRSLDPSAGDLRAGEARDTSIEIRATIAAGVICSVLDNRIALVPRLARAGLLASASATPGRGDTLWVLVDTAAVEQWIARRIDAVGAAADQCPGGSAPRLLTTGEASLMSRTFQLDSAISEVVAAGAPVRITRPARYSLYRSGDGKWYLGLSEWSAERLRFDPVQPVSGPYATAGRKGLRFRYYDRAEGDIAPGASDTRAIARIDITLVSEDEVATGGAHSAGARDSIVLAIAIRNPG